MTPDKELKTFTSKKGNTVVFRYVHPKDLEAMLSHINAHTREDMFISTLSHELTLDEEKVYLEGVLADMTNGKGIYITVEVNGKYAGNGEFCRRNEFKMHHVAVLGISLGMDFREEGIGSILFETLISEAKLMGIKVLELSCFENNQRAIHVYEKMGFRKAGMIPGALWHKNEYIGEVKMYLPLAS